MGFGPHDDQVRRKAVEELGRKAADGQEVWSVACLSSRRSNFLGTNRVLQDRVDAVEEIISSSSEKLVVLRQLLKKLPDLAKGLCRIQYGKVRH